jgi:hypothetical protein
MKTTRHRHRSSSSALGTENMEEDIAAIATGAQDPAGAVQVQQSDDAATGTSTSTSLSPSASDTQHYPILFQFKVGNSVSDQLPKDFDMDRYSKSTTTDASDSTAYFFKKRHNKVNWQVSISPDLSFVASLQNFTLSCTAVNSSEFYSRELPIELSSDVHMRHLCWSYGGADILVLPADGLHIHIYGMDCSPKAICSFGPVLTTSTSIRSASQSAARCIAIFVWRNDDASNISAHLLHENSAITTIKVNPVSGKSSSVSTTSLSDLSRRGGSNAVLEHAQWTSATDTLILFTATTELGKLRRNDPLPAVRDSIGIEIYSYATGHWSLRHQLLIGRGKPTVLDRLPSVGPKQSSFQLSSVLSWAPKYLKNSLIGRDNKMSMSSFIIDSVSSSDGR